MSQIEEKTNKIQQRIDLAQSQLDKAEETLEDLPAAEAISREIEVLQEEKQTLEKHIAQYQQQVNYEEVRGKQGDTKVLCVLRYKGQQVLFKLFFSLHRNSWMLPIAGLTTFS